MTYKAAKKKAEEDFENVTPVRAYTDTELSDFHKKIQRFWDPERKLENGEIAQKFRYQDLAVAYGALRPEMVGKHIYYSSTPERYLKLNVLWNQYGEWRRKLDWIGLKRAEESAVKAEVDKIPF